MDLDSLAEADIDLDTLRISDLGIDVKKIGFMQVHGIGCEIVTSDAESSFNVEESDWMNRVLDTARRVHAVGVCRFYVCKPGETQWQYTGLYGGAAVVTEANLQLSCAHFIRLVDLDGFNPNTSVMMQQELYTGMKYTRLSSFFHTFEMSKYTAGFSFVTENEANIFYDAVQFCLTISARDIVEEEYGSKETTFRLVGATDWSRTDGSISVKVAQKYAGGGITDGLEVRWKKPSVSPELAALLSANGVEVDTSHPESPGRAGGPSEAKAEPVDAPETPGVIDLMKDPNMRRKTMTVTEGRTDVGDGVTMSWKKNATPLTGLEAAAAAPAPVARAPAPESNRKSKGGFFSKKKKK